ncbi:Putative formate dehydrogenase accessory protein, FdhD protein homolog [Tenacibaculum maritimum]|nr:Putative formate dehydrogenase accessory protein, FdhD protein homolog [Tenacibaculum maritimum]CAA0194407.1 Putative formate dehydrogenase accessory protein, FdhD protein homolog [Tenacibaculum maritimum]CAA0197535.1 Putative formate dehydrogenase accessory protein, FdhD protein homolog [Tenacibaculum maritimum]CAA0205395.1 Putative formate dehydrogenase accessory protein, FdhD protein homolog [Tenacibaculum maritimum]
MKIMQKLNYQAIKTSSLKSLKFDDELVMEAPLQININSSAYTVVMRTPNDDIELIRGLLYAEDIYKEKRAIQIQIEEIKENQSAIMNCIIPTENLGKGYLNKRTLLSVSSCGICGKQELEDLTIHGKELQKKKTIKLHEIKAMYQQMHKNQSLFHATGGSHAAAIFSKQNKLLVVKEDIGRHNAVDKCIGKLLLHDTLKEANTMLVSGRVSYEIISKAFFAKIPIIIAVSACSSLAVDYAKEFGICLIGFHRNNTMTIYSNPQYISDER